MPQIPQTTIDQIKQTTDLVKLIRTHNVPLRKRGNTYKGHCPFHDDKKTASFSVNVEKNLWHCFGCDEGGDAIRFVEKIENISFPQAVEKLLQSPETPKKKAVKTKKPRPRQNPKPKTKTPTLNERHQLLTRITEYYQKRLTQNPKALNYLKSRGIDDVKIIQHFKIGYADETISEILPKTGQLRDQLQHIGIINPQGTPLMQNCVVFPLTESSGAIVNFYARSLTDGDYKHLYLPGERLGLFNPNAVQRAETVILAESVIDALSLIQHGFSNAMTCYGTNGLTPSLITHLQVAKVQVVLAFDADEAGQKGAIKIKQILADLPLNVHILNLPEQQDLNSYFQNHDKHDFQALLDTTLDSGAYPTVKKEEKNLLKTQNGGFLCRFGPRCYEVKAIARQATQLKTTVKAYEDVKKGFELHTLDLYSARSREAYIKSCAALFKQPFRMIQQDMTQLIDYVENYTPDKAEPDKTPVSPAIEKAAEAFLKNPKLFDELLADLDTLGLVGATGNKLIGYLACISRKLAEPLSLLIQSRSAAGKSTLQNTLLSLVPSEDKVEYTRMTDQALFYQEETALVHKVLALEEAEGLGGAAYSLRALQSAKHLSIATTGKDPVTGRMQTEQYTVQGPVAVMLTTTSSSLDEETLSRFLTLTIDESTQMTETILNQQRLGDTLEGYKAALDRQHIIEKHHTAQRGLTNIVVLNPYAEQLHYPVHSIRARRDHKKYLMLIKVIAFMQQHQRSHFTATCKGERFTYINVEKQDINLANKLVVEVLQHSQEELSAPAKRLLIAIHEHVNNYCDQHQCSATDYIFTRKNIREAVGWSDWQIRTYSAELEKLEYLKSRSGAWGKEYRYELSWSPEQQSDIKLADPEQLVEHNAEKQPKQKNKAVQKNANCVTP